MLKPIAFVVIVEQNDQGPLGVSISCLGVGAGRRPGFFAIASVIGVIMHAPACVVVWVCSSRLKPSVYKQPESGHKRVRSVFRLVKSAYVVSLKSLMILG